MLQKFINAARISNVYFNDINQQLLSDIYQTRLKSFLKCEDRCSMFHSVESRTPFSDDVDLINLMFSFNGNKKIKNGVSKFLLREALKSKLPSEIYYRYDKKGFETQTLSNILNKLEIHKYLKAPPCRRVLQC